MKYDDFVRSLCDTYVRAKKTENELRSEKVNIKYQTQTFYEDLIRKIKDEYEVRISKMQETAGING